MKIEWRTGTGGWIDLHIDGHYVFCAYKTFSDGGKIRLYAQGEGRGLVDTIEEARAVVLALYMLESEN